MENRFHACATCIHYGIIRMDNKQQFLCTRLGYETRPNYRFNCWTPKDHVRKLIEREREKKKGE